MQQVLIKRFVLQDNRHITQRVLVSCSRDFCRNLRYSWLVVWNLYGDVKKKKINKTITQSLIKSLTFHWLFFHCDLVSLRLRVTIVLVSSQSIFHKMYTQFDIFMSVHECYEKKKNKKYMTVHKSRNILCDCFCFFFFFIAIELVESDDKNRIEPHAQNSCTRVAYDAYTCRSLTAMAIR